MCPDRGSLSASGVWVLFSSLLSCEIWEQALDILIYKNEKKEGVTVWRKIFFVSRKLVWWRGSWIRVSEWGTLEGSRYLMRSAEWAGAKDRRICPSSTRPGQGTLGSRTETSKPESLEEAYLLLLRSSSAIFPFPFNAFWALNLRWGREGCWALLRGPGSSTETASPFPCLEFCGKLLAQCLRALSTHCLLMWAAQGRRENTVLASSAASVLCLANKLIGQMIVQSRASQFHWRWSCLSLLPRRHLAKSGDNFGCHSWPGRVLWASSRQKLRRTDSSMTKPHLALNVHSAELENPDMGPFLWWPPRMNNQGAVFIAYSEVSFFILFMGFSRQEYWSGLPFPSPVDHILSDLSTTSRLSCVAPHSMG